MKLTVGVEKRNVTTIDTFMDLVRNLVPENLVQACLEKVQTVIKYPGQTLENATIREDDKLTWKFEEKWAPSVNFTNIFYQQLFLYKSVLSSFSLLTIWRCNFFAKEYQFYIETCNATLELWK